MKEHNNPQKFTPEDFGGDEGWRLLTVEESATSTWKRRAR
jgi:hypothetical protein